MIKEFKKHSLHYLILILMLSLGSFAIYTFRFNPALKTTSLIATAFLYLLWGIVHHHLSDHLRIEVVLEYFLVSVLGVLIINSLI